MNPAVTLTMAMLGKLKPIEASYYPLIRTPCTKLQTLFGPQKRFGVADGDRNTLFRPLPMIIHSNTTNNYYVFHILPQIHTANHATLPIQMYANTV